MGGGGVNLLLLVTGWSSGVDIRPVLLGGRVLDLGPSMSCK